MKEVAWVDGQGYMRKALVKEDDPVSMAPFGIRLEPPPVDVIDWDGVKRDLHNALMERGVRSWEDLMGTKRDIITEVVVAALSGRVKDLLRQGGV